MDSERETDSVPGMSFQTVPARKGGPTMEEPRTKWRTPAQEKIYGQKLLEAIRSARHSSQPSEPCPSRAIKEAADSALAHTARGQSRWSRAILSRQWRKRKLLLKIGGKIRRCSARRRPGKSLPPPPPMAVPAGKKEEKLRERLRLLSRLVPGCRKLSTPTLLDEAADYVAALQMQVKAMRVLADRLSAAALTQNQS
ncbi:transcription factor bHLH149-like [Aristolochia californica]|uniref:transcription factor bHLH149-like n=1 Tax=Aristolochia californica TaxID=171875 RepID=UPI0035D6BE74